MLLLMLHAEMPSLNLGADFPNRDLAQLESRLHTIYPEVFLIYCGMETNMGLGFILLTIFSRSFPQEVGA